MADAPLCKNCRHRAAYNQCARPLSGERSPVDGNFRYRLNSYCETERHSARTLFGRKKCGPEGVFFETQWHVTTVKDSLLRELPDRPAPPPQRGG